MRYHTHYLTPEISTFHYKCCTWSPDIPFDLSQYITSDISKSLSGNGMLLLLHIVFKIPGNNVVLPICNINKSL